MAANRMALSMCPDACGTRWGSWFQAAVAYFRRIFGTIRYDTGCCFNVRSKADMSQLNLPHGTDNKKCKTEKLKSKNGYAQK